MTKQTYLLWRCGDRLKFKVPMGIHEVGVTLERERELRDLLRKWEQEWAKELGADDGR